VAEPDRIVAMALEVDTVGPGVLAAADRVVEEGRLGQLLDALAQVGEAPAAAPEVWARLATPDVVRRLAGHEPVDFKTLERLVPRVGLPAAAPLLDALATAEARSTRRGLLAQLAKMGPELARIVIARLDDPRWYVTRNLLALLEDLAPLPAGFSASSYLGHTDARVRWQAVKLQVTLPAQRDAALAARIPARCDWRSGWRWRCNAVPTTPSRRWLIARRTARVRSTCAASRSVPSGTRARRRRSTRCSASRPGAGACSDGRSCVPSRPRCSPR